MRPAKPRRTASVALAEPVSDARRRLIDAAVSLFEANGYKATSVRQVTDAAGIAKATFYHYFPDKSALLFEIHDHFMSVLEEGAARIRELGAAPAERLRLEIHDLWRVLALHGPYVRVFFEEWRHLRPEHLEEIRRRRRRYFEVVRDTVAEGSRSGEFQVSEETLDVVTRAVFGMCNWAYQWFDEDGPLTHDEIAQVYADFAISALRDRETRGEAHAH